MVTSTGLATLSLQAGFFSCTQQAVPLADLTVGRADQCLKDRKLYFIHIHPLVPLCEQRGASATLE